MSIPVSWFEDFFHGIALDLWRQAIPPSQTRAEGQFLVKAIGCEPGAHLLDVPCGNGRLSFELAERGYRVTGVDISEEFIDEARSTSKKGAAIKGSIDFQLGDMRRIKGESLYDGAYCFGNSFGFLEYDDMMKFVAGVARALKPDGRFIIETAMAAESVLPDFEEQALHQIGDISMTTKERYLAEESCIDSEYIFERNGIVESRKAKHWIYTVAEIRRMLEGAGFTVISLHGSLQFDPCKLGSRELFVIARNSAAVR